MSERRTLEPGQREGVLIRVPYPQAGLDMLKDLFDVYYAPTPEDIERTLAESGPRIGAAVTGDREAYQYLVESIRKFPRPERFADMIRAAGFRRVSFTPMTAGVVALHSGWKL